ncbi:hypothetical protein GDO81_026490 [Engystomops pustulosus]|uniref:Uncharacterized protein n=1 Tax=Engystomops pustulosus TaxID=76066 RepID=A0AAV6YGS7_ENGPU|nr:hypothetical protein GDO81_026490 [Engystomops pustulosus]
MCSRHVFQVKAALHYLKTFYETEKIPNFIPSEDPKWLQLMVYLRKNTGEARTLDVTFPHDFKTHKIYLFTKNEPNMSIKETENFYETFLHQNDVRQKIEIIPLSKVHTSMPWLKKNGTFLVDKRIHSDLLTQLGGYWRR